MILDEPTTSNNDEIEHLLHHSSTTQERGQFVHLRLAQNPRGLPDRRLLHRAAQRRTCPAPGPSQRLLRSPVTAVGEQYADEDVYRPRELGPVVLELDRVTSTAFRDVSLTVRQGEIVALTGLPSGPVN